MNLQLPEKEKMQKRTITIYVIAAAICVLAIIVVIGIQILGNDVIDDLFGINKLVKRTEQEEAELKANFESLFKNQFENEQGYTTSKEDESKELVYTSYNIKEKTEKHELNINLPYINIKNRDIQAFNEEIANIFEAKAKEVSQDTSKNVIYTVNYLASIKNNILSVVLYSDLKQDTSAQRTIIETFNFNLEEKKKLSLEETLKIYNLSKNDAQSKINIDIKGEQDKAEELKKLGYNIFSRDINSDIYKVENIEEYFIYNDNIYVVFAYGNNSLTSERDIVIL